MKNILVCINFDELADLQLEKARELAEKFNSKVWIVHIAAPNPDFAGNNEDLKYIDSNRAKELREEHRKLQQYGNNLKDKGINTECMLIQGPTIDTIVDESVKLNADLIIIGYADHGFLYKLFLGSSSPGVIRKSKVPVLVVPFYEK